MKINNSLKDFKLFRNIKKNVNDKLCGIAEHKYYYCKDNVYSENSPVDGIYFIIKGTFLITKRQPLVTKEDRLNKIDKELEYLLKEGEMYMKCVNGKYGISAKPIISMKKKLHAHKYSLGLDDSRKLITKSLSPITSLAILNEGNIFGDIELISKEPFRSYSIACTSEKGEVIYFSHKEFLHICTDVMLEKLNEEVLKKASLFSMKYKSDINIKESKCIVNNYAILPTDINKIHVDRNNKHPSEHSKINSSFKLNNTTYSKFILPLVNDYNQKNKGYFSNDKGHHKSKSNYCDYNMFINNSRSQWNDKMNTTQINIQTIKGKNKVCSDSTMMLLNSDTITNANSSNNVSSIYTQNASGYFPPGKMQSYVLTKMKYPVSKVSLKKKITFHFKNKENNIKSVLLTNNLREVKVSFSK